MEWAPLRNLDCLFPLVPGMAEVTLLDGRARAVDAYGKGITPRCGCTYEDAPSYVTTGEVRYSIPGCT